MTAEEMAVYFGELQNRVEHRAFDGARLTAVAGTCRLDLRQATAHAASERVIDLFCTEAALRARWDALSDPQREAVTARVKADNPGLKRWKSMLEPLCLAELGRLLDSGEPLPEAASAQRSLFPDARAGHRYAPDKWSIREVVGHMSDTERIFTYRALRIARGDDTPLPGFDENAFVSRARLDDRAFAGLIDEYAAVRAASVALFDSLFPEEWTRRGIAR